VSKKTFIGYVPFPHQKAVHNALNGGYRSGKIYVVRARRQVGKSIMVEQELLRYAITYKGTVSACVCPTLSQARKMFQDIIYSIIDSGVVRKKNETLLEIDLINGSKIFFKSAEQRDSLRGYTISGLLCVDECAFISDEVFYELLLAWTNVHQAPILLTSTPKFKIGFYWSYWNIGVQKTNPNVVAIDFNDYDTSALLPNDKLEEYRKLLPKGKFLTEYMGEFLDSESIVFGDFKKCIGGEIKEYKDIFIGIDWSSGVGSDYTVVTGVNERNEQVFLVYFNNKTAVQQIDYIKEYLSLYKDKIRCIVAETNGVGKPLVDNLRTALDWCKNINDFTTTNSEKVRLINRLQVDFEQGTIQLLDDEKQTNELSAYECVVKSNNTITFNAPIGGNDDTVMALMFAEEARELKNKKGRYTIL
jgi:hypothetical protein